MSSSSATGEGGSKQWAVGSGQWRRTQPGRKVPPPHPGNVLKLCRINQSTIFPLVSHPPFNHYDKPTNLPLPTSTMSERTPLLPTHAPNPSSLLPSQSTRLQLSHALGAYKAGKLPSQTQLSALIDLAISSDFLKPSGGSSRTARLGEEGSRVLSDFKEVLRGVKKWGEEKNGDDLLQNILWEFSESDLDVETGELGGFLGWGSR